MVGSGLGLGLVFGIGFLRAITIFVPLRFSSSIFFFFAHCLFTMPSDGTFPIHCFTASPVCPKYLSHIFSTSTHPPSYLSADTLSIGLRLFFYRFCTVEFIRVYIHMRKNRRAGIQYWYCLLFICSFIVFQHCRFPYLAITTVVVGWAVLVTLSEPGFCLIPSIFHLRFL